MNYEANKYFQSKMRALMKEKAKTHQRFLSQKEFNENQGEVLLITHKTRKLDNETNKV